MTTRRRMTGMKSRAKAEQGMIMIAKALEDWF